VGVIQNIYCIPKRPSTASWAELLQELLRHGCIAGEFLTGSAFDEEIADSYLRTPNVPLSDISARGLSCYPDVSRAVESVSHLKNAVINVEAEAQTYRREPESFYAGGAELALYRFGDGHHLVVGKPDDLSDIAESDPELYECIKPASLDPAWEGTIHEMVWLSGKNAPLREDFVGSRFHGILQSCWPDHLIVEDCVP